MIFFFLKIGKLFRYPFVRKGLFCHKKDSHQFYARFKSGVSNYVVKPFTAETITEKFDKVFDG